MAGSVIVHVNRAYTVGLSAILQCRQGGITDGFGVAGIAGFVNHLAARRVHVLAQGGDSIGSATVASINLRGRFHTSPYCNRVEALVIAGRTVSGTTLGRLTWTVNSYALPDMYVAGSIGGTTGPQDLSILRTQLVSAANTPLVGDTDYDWSLAMGSVPINVLFYVIYEVPRETLNPSTDGTPALETFSVGAPILDRDIATLTDTLWKIYRRSGIPQFSHSTLAATTPSATATFKNVLDSGTAGYSANAAGWWTIPYRKNRMTKTTLNVVLWHVGNIDPLNPASDGVVRWVNAAGTIGSITGINTSASTIRTTTATIDASTSGSQLVIVEHSSATSTIFTRGCGMIELI